MTNCTVCGSAMAHFENPPRDICPNEPHSASEKVGKGSKPGESRGDQRKRRSHRDDNKSK